MARLTLVHTSAWRLGRQDVAGVWRVADYLDAAASLVQGAIQANADLVVVAGDTFSHARPSPTLVRAWAERVVVPLRQAGIHLFLLVGAREWADGGRAHVFEALTAVADPGSLTVGARVGVTALLTRSGKPYRVLAVPAGATGEEIASVETAGEGPLIVAAYLPLEGAARLAGPALWSPELLVGLGASYTALGGGSAPRLRPLAATGVNTLLNSQPISWAAPQRAAIGYEAGALVASFGEGPRGYIRAEISSHETRCELVPLQGRPMLMLSWDWYEGEQALGPLVQDEATIPNLLRERLLGHAAPYQSLAGACFQVRVQVSTTWRPFIRPSLLGMAFPHAKSVIWNWEVKAPPRLVLPTAVRREPLGLLDAYLKGVGVSGDQRQQLIQAATTLLGEE